MDSSEARKLIGSRIRLARAARNLTQQNLADTIGVDKMTVSRWERGIRSPDGEFLLAITKTCGCTGDFLLGLSDTITLRRDE